MFRHIVQFIGMLIALGMMVVAALPGTPGGWVNRVMLGFFGLSVLLALARWFQYSWRRHGRFETVDPFTLYPNGDEATGEFPASFRGELRGCGRAEIIVVVDTAPFVTGQEAVVITVRLTRGDDVQSDVCGFRPVPEEKRLKTFRIALRATWSARIEIDLAPDSGTEDAIEVVLFTWANRQEVDVDGSFDPALA